MGGGDRGFVMFGAIADLATSTLFLDFRTLASRLEDTNIRGEFGLATKSAMMAVVDCVRVDDEIREVCVGLMAQKRQKRTSDSELGECATS